MKELDMISNRVLTSLEKQKIADNIPLDTNEPLDLRDIELWFRDISKELIGDFIESTKLKKHVISRNRFMRKHPDLNSDTHWNGLFRVALLDIYSMVLLHINFGINSNILKGIIYLNMNQGNACPVNLPASVIWNTISQDTKEVDVSLLITSLKEHSKQKLSLHTIGEPSCSFYHSDYRIEWVEGVWDYFEKKLIPKMQEKYKGGTDYIEKFYSGNLK